MSTSFGSRIGPGPQDGDIVVTRESASSERYTVHQLPGALQLSASVRAEAVRLARSFALKHRVDVWYSENGSDHLLEAYRPTPDRDKKRGADS